MTGAVSCVQCKACLDNMYRVECTSELALLLLVDAPIGMCVDCPACTNPNKVLLGCMSNAGHNNMIGTCVSRDYIDYKHLYV